MSLINEALRRAQQERRTHPRRPRPLPVRPDAARPTPQAAPKPESKPTGGRGVIVLAVCVVATVAATMYLSLPPARPDAGPDASPPAPAAAANVAVPGPSPAPAAPADAIPSDLTRIKPALLETTLIPPPAPAAGAIVARPDPIAADPSASPVVASIDPPPSAPPAASPPGPARGTYTLGAILRSGGVSCAIVNDRLVAVGETIDGARVVAIEQYRVVLETPNRRLTLRM